MTKKKARFGALPKLNMPKKSHQSTKPAPRTTRTSLVQETDLSCVNHGYYKSFLNLCQRVKSLKTIDQWTKKVLPDRLILKKVYELFLLPKLEIIIDDSLGYTAKV